MTVTKETSRISVEIANLLAELNGEDVASAIIMALEKWSIALEDSSETQLRGCLVDLEEKIEKRHMSI